MREIKNETKEKILGLIKINLKDIRLAGKLRQVDVAKELGVARYTYIRYETTGETLNWNTAMTVLSTLNKYPQCAEMIKARGIDCDMINEINKV